MYQYSTIGYAMVDGYLVATYRLGAYTREEALGNHEGTITNARNLNLRVIETRRRSDNELIAVYPFGLDYTW